jgi:hypothetical protein
LCLTKTSMLPGLGPMGSHHFRYGDHFPYGPLPCQQQPGVQMQGTLFLPGSLCAVWSSALAHLCQKIKPGSPGQGVPLTTPLDTCLLLPVRF